MKRLWSALPAAVIAFSLFAPLQVRAGAVEPARDPFRPYFLSVQGSVNAGPLSRFAVDDLHVDGIVSGIAAPRALVRTPDGESYDVGVGAVVGNRGGHIAEITRDAVVVVERIDESNSREIILGLVANASR